MFSQVGLLPGPPTEATAGGEWSRPGRETPQGWRRGGLHSLVLFLGFLVSVTGARFLHLRDPDETTNSYRGWQGQKREQKDKTVNEDINTWVGLQFIIPWKKFSNTPNIFIVGERLNAFFRDYIWKTKTKLCIYILPLNTYRTTNAPITAASHLGQFSTGSIKLKAEFFCWLIVSCLVKLRQTGWRFACHTFFSRFKFNPAQL